VATLIWLPTMHLVFTPDLEEYRTTDGIAPRAHLLAARHLALWQEGRSVPPDIAQMRLSNPEWDFMGRTFLVMALANMALRDPSLEEDLVGAMDRIISDTLALERTEGMHHFLMAYSEASPFVVQPERSIFIDGEIALMVAHRRMVRDRPDLETELHERMDLMVDRMRRSPVLSAESYPDECWTFCNTAALAAMAITDHLDGTDHSGLASSWVETARQRLVHEETGLLVSSYTLDGEHRDGPEGSSIWFVSHALAFVDPRFARDQYERARAEIGRAFLGFGYSREWPVSWSGPQDIDSGPVILGASPGASGLAILGASTFDDERFLGSLLASLNAAAFPLETPSGLRFMASNQVGDAVLLYALVQGPVRDRVAGGGTP
jgi:hypothetical protein